MSPGKIIVAVGAIVHDERGRILLVKHRPERGGFWQGRWIFPGGKLAPGESIAEGARREVREETGLEIEVLAPNPLAERIVREDRGGPQRGAPTGEGEVPVALHVLYVTHMARKVGGVLRPASDVGEARWVTRGELARAWGELHEDTQAIASLAGLGPHPDLLPGRRHSHEIAEPPHPRLRGRRKGTRRVSVPSPSARGKGSGSP